VEAQGVDLRVGEVHAAQRPLAGAVIGLSPLLPCPFKIVVDLVQGSGFRVQG